MSEIESSVKDGLNKNFILYLLTVMTTNMPAPIAYQYMTSALEGWKNKTNELTEQYKKTYVEQIMESNIRDDPEDVLNILIDTHTVTSQLIIEDFIKEIEGLIKLRCGQEE